MRQVETSRTLVFGTDVHARAFFEALLCENMDLGRPENAGLLFRRGQRPGAHSSPPPGGGFKTRIDRHCDMVTMNVFCKNSRLKQYACFCTRVYDHVLRPLMAPGRPSAPPELAAALDTLDQLTAGHIARARVPTAA